MNTNYKEYAMKNTLYYVGDFETTIYDGQEYTEVWASAICPIPENTEDLEKLNEDKVMVHNCIDDTWNWLKRSYDNVVVYYHNLKFDGHFWLDFLLKKGYKNALDANTGEWKRTQDMLPGEIKYTISAQGLWYSITIKVRNQIGNRDDVTVIEFRDSLKLIPFSVKEIGKAFQTKYQKLEMEYVGERHAGGVITANEMKYIKNDVLVMAEAMYRIMEEGMNKTTIGSCCVADYKSNFDNEDFNILFPNLKNIILPTGEDCDQYVRESYHGGWCYVNPKYKGKEVGNGYTLDVNSLYPSMMHSSSGNYFPVGKPKYLEPNEFDEKKERYERKNVYYYFIRFKCRFKLKEGYLPFVQIRDNIMYNGREHLATSDVRGKDGKFYDHYKNLEGMVVDAKPCMTMTCTDWELFNKHYNVTELEVLDYVIFRAYPAKILFDSYINKHMEVKKREKGVKRTIAKLKLNNLYGKTATSDDSSYKICNIVNNKLKMTIVRANNKPVWYIPVGSAITSYARNFTITTAQQNIDKFCYADTDSIHCVGDVLEVRAVKIDDSELCCWKLEQEWDVAIFVRPKTYIEHVGQHFDIKCAGMPQKCKNLVAICLGEQIVVNMSDEDLGWDFIEHYNNDFTLQDFKPGLNVPGKLYPKVINGGMILEEGFYTMKENM